MPVIGALRKLGRYLGIALAAAVLSAFVYEHVGAWRDGRVCADGVGRAGALIASRFRPLGYPGFIDRRTDRPSPGSCSRGTPLALHAPSDRGRDGFA